MTTSVAERLVAVRAAVPRPLWLSACAAVAAAGIGLSALEMVVDAVPGIVGMLGLVLLAAAAAAVALGRFEIFVLGLVAIRATSDLGTRGLLDVNTAASVALLVTGTLWLAAHSGRGGGTVTGLPAMAVLGAAALSTVFSADPQTSAIQVLRLASALLMVELLQRLVAADPRVRQRLLLVFLLSAVPPVLLGLTQVLTGTGGQFIGDFYRVQGTFTHPNPFAVYLVLVVTTAVAVAPTVLRPGGRLAAYGLGAAGTVCLVFTYTRSAWFALVVSLAVVAWVQRRPLMGAALALAGAVAALTPPVMERFADLATSTQASGDAGNSLVWRVQYWLIAVDTARDRPVTGLGVGTLREVADQGKEAHNDAVRAFAEMGALGLLAYLAWIAALLLLAVRAVRGAGDDTGRALAAGFAGVMAAVVLLSLVSNVYSQVVLVWYVGVCAALASATANRPGAARAIQEPRGRPGS